MRPTAFDPQRLRAYLHRHMIADLPALKHALGASSDLTVFRKLKALGYLSSYTHRGRFYTLRTIPRFDKDGLWSHAAVWFSRHRTLMATLEASIPPAPQGWFPEDLADRLHVHVHHPLHELVRQGRADRAAVAAGRVHTPPHGPRAHGTDPAPRAAPTPPPGPPHARPPRCPPDTHT